MIKWKKKKFNAYPQKRLRGSSRVNREAYMRLDVECNEKDITDNTAIVKKYRYTLNERTAG